MRVGLHIKVVLCGWVRKEYMGRGFGDLRVEEGIVRMGVKVVESGTIGENKRNGGYQNKWGEGQNF